MAYYKIEDNTLTAIGNAIRSKNGSTNTMTPAEMATAIENISNGATSVATCSVSFKYKTFNGFTIYQTPSGWTAHYGSSAKTIDNIIVGSSIFIVADKSSSYSIDYISTSNSTNGKLEQSVLQDSSSAATYVVINGDVTLTINGKW